MNSTRRPGPKNVYATDLRVDHYDAQIKAPGGRTEERQRETDRQLRELGKQIGGLGNKFGSFTEGLALPSMEKILRRRFGVDTVAPSVRVSRGGQHLELDVLAYANGAINAAYVVEVKSHLREEHIQQLLEILEQFAAWFPEHRGKQLYGILAAVHIPAALRPRVLEQGLSISPTSTTTCSNWKSPTISSRAASTAPSCNRRDQDALPEARDGKSHNSI